MPRNGSFRHGSSGSDETEPLDGEDEEESDESEDEEYIEDDDSGSWLARFRHRKNMHGEDIGCVGWYFLKWFVPGLTFALCFLFQNFCLHIATHYYIVWMERINIAAETAHINVTRAHLYTDNHAHNGHERLSQRFVEGSLHDVSVLLFGHHKIPMHALDSVSILIPGSWFLLVVYQINLHLFTKCCLCGSLLAVGKGVFGFVTVVPDSIGWLACKKRLGEKGLEVLGDAINFSESWQYALSQLASPNAFHYRYCADMVYSGHTYFCALFAVGLYDAFRRYSHFWPPQRKFFARTALGCVLLAYTIVDVVLMLMNSFHYSLDVLLALLLVLLYYTNAAIARATMWWSEEVWVERGNIFEMSEATGTHWSGEIMIPPCCIPCCCLSGRYFLLKQGPYEELLRAVHRYDAKMLMEGDDATHERVRAALEFHEEASRKKTQKPRVRLIRDVQNRIDNIKKYYEDVTENIAEIRERHGDPKSKKKQAALEKELLSELVGGSSSILGTIKDQYHWYRGKPPPRSSRSSKTAKRMDSV